MSDLGHSNKNTKAKDSFHNRSENIEHTFDGVQMTTFKFIISDGIHMYATTFRPKHVGHSWVVQNSTFIILVLNLSWH
jgi:hypothetical protein